MRVRDDFDDLHEIGQLNLESRLRMREAEQEEGLRLLLGLLPLHGYIRVNVNNQFQFNTDFGKKKKYSVGLIRMTIGSSLTSQHCLHRYL